MRNTALAIVGVIALLVLFSISSYNSLVRQDEQVKQSWAQVENVYQRRADLIPNLVSTVKGYAQHEQITFLEVTQARASVGKLETGAAMQDPKAFESFVNAQNQMGSALSRLLVTVERYPDLKANQNFLQLQSQLEGTENRITVERQRYNVAAQEFNQTIRQFPRTLFANWFNFKSKPYFAVEKSVMTAPKVEF